MLRIALLAGFVFSFLIPSSISAQQWSAEQNELWADIEEFLDDFWSGNMDEAFRAVHPDFVFWNDGNSSPGTRAMALELDSFQAENGEYNAMSGTPLTMQVFDDFAIVNAYIRGYQTEPGGEPTFVTRRWHSAWKNEGGRWLQVSNFGYAEQ